MVRRRKFDQDLGRMRSGWPGRAGRPIVHVPRDLGINKGTVGNWVNADRRRRGEGADSAGANGLCIPT
jgi:transposase